MKSIAVFCGSSSGASSIYIESAKQVGQEIAKRNITLIYGGASVGVMGAVADSVLTAGGEAVGVIPHFLDQREIAHTHLTELIIVDSMHERKAKMVELADGFLALPGGPGTLEEFFEVFTWAQLGLHKKPCGLLNINHYYDSLHELFTNMISEQFMQEKYQSILNIEEDINKLLDQFQQYTPPEVKTYIKNKDQT